MAGSWIKAMTTSASPLSLIFLASSLTCSAESLMSSPLTFSGLDLATVRLDVVPTSAILTPSRSTMMYGLTSRVPSSLKMFAPICLSLVPGMMRSIRSW